MSCYHEFVVIWVPSSRVNTHSKEFSDDNLRSEVGIYAKYDEFLCMIFKPNTTLKSYFRVTLF